jgi:hypothetical protein
MAEIRVSGPLLKNRKNLAEDLSLQRHFWWTGLDPRLTSPIRAPSRVRRGSSVFEETGETGMFDDQ